MRTSTEATDRPRGARRRGELRRMFEEPLLDGAGPLEAHLDGVLGTAGVVAVDLLHRGSPPGQGLTSHGVELVGEDPEEALERRRRPEALDPEGDLHEHLGELLGLLPDRPAPVGGLAPGGPVQAEVDPDPGRPLFAREAVGGLEAHVAQEDVDLEPLLHGLALQQGPFEGFPERGDEVDEQVVEHVGAEATVPTMAPSSRLGPWTRTAGHRLCPPGWGMGRPVVDAPCHPGCPRGGGDCRRARRARHGRRAPGGEPRPDRRPNDGRHGGDRRR